MSVMMEVSWGSWACSEMRGSFFWSAGGQVGVEVVSVSGRVLDAFRWGALLLLGSFLYKGKVQLKLSEVSLHHGSLILVDVD